MNNYEFLDKLAKRASKTKMVLLLIVLVIMVVMVAVNFNSLMEAKAGPTALEPYDLYEKDIDETTLYEIELNDDYYRFETAMFEGDEIDTYYMGTLIQDGILVVEVRGSFDFDLPYKMQGHFSPIDNDIKTALSDELLKRNPNGEYYFVSYTFKDDHLDVEGFAVVLAFVSIIFVLILLSYIKSLRFKSSKLHKQMKKLGDATAIADEIEREYEMSKVVSEGPVYLFTNYIVVGTTGIAFVLPKNDVIWSYPKVTKVKRYFITISTKHEVIMGTRHGKTHIVASKEEEVKRILNMMQSHHPACVYGYSDEIQKLYKKNLSEFIQIAESQREASIDEDNY